MKKIIKTILLIKFIILFSSKYLIASPPYDGTIFYFPNTITSNDKSALGKISYINQQGRKMFDRRVNDWVQRRAFIFDVSYIDNLTIEFQVNAEFESEEIAFKEVEFYAYVIGQLPHILRTDVKTVWIHKGNYDFGGGNYNLLIHVGRAEDDYIPKGILEEVFIHEAVHTSLNWQKHSTSLTSKEKNNENLGLKPEWIAAQKKDKNYISDYAKKYSKREDMAESFLPYLAVKYRKSKISKLDIEKITKTIPNRIEFFEKQKFNLFPFN